LKPVGLAAPCKASAKAGRTFSVSVKNKVFHFQLNNMSSAKSILPWSAAVSAVVNILSETFDLRVMVYIFKPLTLVIIIAMVLIGMKGNRKFYSNLVLLGLLFSLMGDVLLMLPADLFVQGLVSFLIAHIFYIMAFSQGVDLRLNSLSWVPFLLFGVLIYGFMLPSLKKMTIPVLAYMVVILTMGWRAYERWFQRKTGKAKSALIGAILFIISDSALGINRFRLPFEWSTLVVLATYFPAQWFIALSVELIGSKQTQ
jgi:uncharacterized membrane protein YhhN